MRALLGHPLVGAEATARSAGIGTLAPCRQAAQRVRVQCNILRAEAVTRPGEDDPTLTSVVALVKLRASAMTGSRFGAAPSRACRAPTRTPALSRLTLASSPRPAGRPRQLTTENRF